MKRKLYRVLANLIEVIQRLEEKGDNKKWEQKHTDRLLLLVKNHMPTGSGFDSGTALNIDASNQNKLIFETSFHHMNDNGYYDGWTQHIIIITPDLTSGYNIKISGRNKNQIKNYMYECFSIALDTEIE